MTGSVRFIQRVNNEKKTGWPASSGSAETILSHKKPEYLIFGRGFPRNNERDLILERRNLIGDDIPEDFKVDSKIPMYECIAEPGN